jgi:plasmid stabilization system protein ParE
MNDVIWSGIARRHLKAIGDYYAQSDGSTANNVLNSIKAAADNLSRYPGAGRQGRVLTTRKLVLNDLPYIIIYQITDKDIRILAVFHTSRKWPGNIN